LGVGVRVTVLVGVHPDVRRQTSSRLRVMAPVWLLHWISRLVTDARAVAFAVEPVMV
jgi:hypothetical protein